MWSFDIGQAKRFNSQIPSFLSPLWSLGFYKCHTSMATIFFSFASVEFRVLLAQRFIGNIFFLPSLCNSRFYRHKRSLTTFFFLLPLWSFRFCKRKGSSTTFFFSLPWNSKFCRCKGSITTTFFFLLPMCSSNIFFFRLCGEKQAKEMRGMGLIYPSKWDVFQLRCTCILSLAI